MLPHCEEVVKPMDVSPERSPQAAHTALLEHMSGKDVAEIGTRRGDGMLCFALAARSALAIEVRPNYCSMLEERDTAYQYVFCDAPSDDPNTTCFLLPDSWHEDIGEQQGEWVCMHNHVGVTLGLSAEDSY